MIRLFLSMSLLIFSTEFLEAQETVPQKVESSDTEMVRLKLNDLLRNRMYLTQEGLVEGKVYSERLSEGDRTSLYQEYEVSGLWGFLNFPYGIGSFVQGDPTTSLLYYAGLLGGSVLVLVGGYAYSYEGSQLGFGVMITGDVIAAAAVIFGQARPWFFANEVNTQLKETLRLSNDRDSP